MVLAHGHRVEYAPRRVLSDLQLLHGQEHSDRKDYIMDKLVVTVEE